MGTTFNQMASCVFPISIGEYSCYTIAYWQDKGVKKLRRILNILNFVRRQPLPVPERIG
jgi:hypothetical protein